MNALLGADAYGMSEEAPVELRILHGAQAGSRLCLSVGEYMLGADDSCTLILEGSGIEDRHAVLRFDGEDAWIDPLDGLVRNAHGDEIDEEEELTFGLPVQLGNVWISVDREDAPWPDHSSVMPIRSGTASGEETRHVLESQDADDPAAENDVATEIDALAAVPSARGRWWPYVFLIVPLLMAGGFGVFSLLQARHVAEVADAIPAVTEAAPDPAPVGVQELLKDFPRTKLVLEQAKEHGQGQARGQWVVTGYVRSSEQQRVLSGLLEPMSPTAQLKVLVEDDLMQAARKLLAADATAVHVKVETVTGGVVQLAGAASSAAEVAKLEARLLADVTGIVEVQSQVLLPEQLRKVLRDRITAAGLADRLVIGAEAPEMNLSGKLTMEEIRRWEDLLVAFNRDYGNVLAIRATVSRLIPKPPVGVLAIVGGAVPYIVTQTGEHVNQGGEVNGHTLVSVKDGEVVFEGRQRVRIAR
ncbi:type III secretion system inner membrane ring subunit SctD [Noviherbaspirillum suwonense]|uniref:Type III secretion apparatus protein, YscD/HrpQ family n=1 Tax=Noviherbaspirillum suwonense TaxID=1224511 RepID=A0ABY1PSC1_9BURK|nr:type III secretion system inner membrane ring subunit SctD [Noviherbaspirillum suwonense]SMP45150.1 type III secretion apparatus protein, YscD/HrpQ family [Noviherbaspirillum suwonense]